MMNNAKQTKTNVVNKPNDPIYCGIDVGKKVFVVSLSCKDKTKTFSNTGGDIKQAMAYLNTYAGTNLALVVLESTGGLEIPLAKALHQSGFNVVIANPNKTSQFAKSCSNAKTDNQDAKMLAFDAKFLSLDEDKLSHLLYVPPSEEQERLEALVVRRHQLVAMRVQEKNRIWQIQDSQKLSVERIIAYLDKEIKDLEQDIDTLSKHFDDTTKKFKDIKGIGGVTVATLMSMLLKLGTLSNKEIASLVGVAPHPKESGTLKYKSHCKGGRQSVRNVLYNATNVARQYEPKFKQFYERLIGKGKPFKVAINACMRKLLTVINAIVRNDSVWQADYHLNLNVK
ncbi:transposase [Moraxella bovis]|uniref:Transposase n=1 Tax=Moraxella bovis TaxID=476 RepID=A0AAQ2SZW4_MORBO|nr:transposase [Moraxella bovis]UYZ75711.1 transposase [Moraxella bovis]UYZ78348.1 transposase [Moraxella bovis]UYZ81234.1 transposase [Moraxella bovis]UYZ86831.1 transposase [Moraxella bovis]UYZ89474.1 transposase [Moraxella bovis]